MDSQNLIVIFRTGFYISIVLAAVGFILAGILYFRYNIRAVWLIKTGRAEKLRVKDLEKESRSNGRMLRDENRAGMQAGKVLVDADAAVSETLKLDEASPGGAFDPPGSAATEVLQPDGKEAVQDGVFGSTADLGPTDASSFGTEVLKCGEYGSTADLGRVQQSDGAGGTELLQPQDSQRQNYRITQEVMVIHTGEIISVR